MPQITCPQCHGDGKLPGTCHVCGGTGVTPTEPTCSNCKGTGEADNERTCPLCDGTGKVNDPRV
jgi:DnaJ-class molecular chaperone